MTILLKRKISVDMAEPLRNMYNPAFFEKLCPVLKQSIPGFDCQNFIHLIFNNSWPDLELKERVRHITHVLKRFLPHDFKKAAAMVVALSKNLRSQGFPDQSFSVIFIPEYIMVYGQEHVDVSLEALGEITKLVSAEFAIRQFLLTHPDLTFSKLRQWSTNENSNVRRLSSEGCRPRLPWGMGVPHLKKDPAEIIRILENLKKDPSEYVRRSVANNLNDIAKDHPNVIINLAKQWRGTDPTTDWIIKHGCRTLLKRGNSHALRIHGFNPSPKSKVISLRLLKKKIKIGDFLHFDFDIVNESRTSAAFRLEYGIDYLTSSGKISRKIFKIAENDFPAGKTINIQRRQSFKDFTTRKHFKGKHMLSILANGKKLAHQEFIVC